MVRLFDDSIVKVAVQNQKIFESIMSRPEFDNIKSGKEFNEWYWLKEEMVKICKRLGLPISGRKFDLRDRIMYALDNGGKLKPKSKKRKVKSKFNWTESELTLDTRITDNISFGPNFRKFMRSHVGKKFSCGSDFMDWMKASEGKTLDDAIAKYFQLEKRKKDSNFERKIEDNNMFNQYTRDFIKDNPGESLANVRKYWFLKKQLPTKNGFVKYERSDLQFEVR